MGRIVRALVVGALALVTAGCWPVPGHNADRSGSNPFETEITTLTVDGLREVWRWTGSDAVTAPVTSPGGVHVLHGCRATTLDPVSGQVRWQAQLGDPVAVCPSSLVNPQPSEPHVAADGKRVLASVMAGYVRPPGSFSAGFQTMALDVGTGAGSIVPEVDFVIAQRGTRVVSFAEYGASFLVTSKGLEIHDLATGTRRGFGLSLQIATPELSPPQVTLGAEALFHSGWGILATEPGDSRTGNAVRAFSPDVPRPGCGPISMAAPGYPTPATTTVECPLWVTPVDGVPTTPVLSPDQSTLYVRTNAGTLYAIDAVNGEVLWTGSGLGDAGRPIYSNEIVYVPTGDGRIVAFIADGCDDEPTCLPYWSYPTGTTEPVSTPAIGGHVLYATAGDTTYAFDAGGCRSMVCSPLWSGPGAGSPVVTNGRVYVSSPEGNGLVVYGLD